MEFEKRRTNKRILVSLPIHFETVETPDKRYGDGVSKDISEGGMRIMLERFFPPKSKFLLKINLGKTNRTIQAMTETIWSVNVRSSHRYYNGMRFLDMNNEDKSLLKEYLYIKYIKDNIKSNKEN
ncbi:PilZ domain-containing protein [Thermoproteota archaeon]